MRATTLLLALAACGKVSNLADAPSGAVDGPPADANVNVTVTVLDPQSGAPLSGVPVVFTDSTGAAVAHPTTDTSGKASQALPGGGSITAILPGGTNAYQLQTVLGVKAGDAITLDEPPTDNTPGTYTVALAPDGAASYYYVYGPCGQQYTTTTSTTLMLNKYCEVPSMDLIAVAYDANNNPLGYVERGGVTYTDGGSTTLPSTWQGFQTFNATATNLTADITNVNVNRYWPDEFGYGAFGSGTIAGTSASASLTGPTSQMAIVETGLYNGTGSFQRIRQRNLGTSTAYNLDVGNNELRFVAAPTLDPSTGTISTPVSGTGSSAPDIFAVYVSYGRTVGSTQMSYSWVVYAPDVADITLPTLPPEVGDVGPHAGDSLGFGTHAALAEYDSLNGYDDARQNPTAAIDEYFSDEGRGPSSARYSQSPLLK